MAAPQTIRKTPKCENIPLTIAAPLVNCSLQRSTNLKHCKDQPAGCLTPCIQQSQEQFTRCYDATKPPGQPTYQERLQILRNQQPQRQQQNQTPTVTCRQLRQLTANQQAKCANIQQLCASSLKTTASCRNGSANRNCNNRLNQLANMRCR